MSINLVSTSPHTLEVVLSQLVSLPHMVPQFMGLGESQTQITFFPSGQALLFLHYLFQMFFPCLICFWSRHTFEWFFFNWIFPHLGHFLRGSLVAQLIICLQCGRPVLDGWVGKIPWRREWLPTPMFWPGEFHGLYSPWGCKESDTTEQFSLTHSLRTFSYRL